MSARRASIFTTAGRRGSSSRRNVTRSVSAGRIAGTSARRSSPLRQTTLGGAIRSASRARSRSRSRSSSREITRRGGSKSKSRSRGRTGGSKGKSKSPTRGRRGSLRASTGSRRSSYSLLRRTGSVGRTGSPNRTRAEKRADDDRSITMQDKWTDELQRRHDLQMRRFKSGKDVIANPLVIPAFGDRPKTVVDMDYCVNNGNAVQGGEAATYGPTIAELEAVFGQKPSDMDKVAFCVDSHRQYSRNRSIYKGQADKYYAELTISPADIAMATQLLLSLGGAGNTEVKSDAEKKTEMTNKVSEWNANHVIYAFVGLNSKDRTGLKFDAPQDEVRRFVEFERFYAAGSKASQPAWIADKVREVTRHYFLQHMPRTLNPASDVAYFVTDDTSKIEYRPWITSEIPANEPSRALFNGTVFGINVSTSIMPICAGTVVGRPLFITPGLGRRILWDAAMFTTGSMPAGLVSIMSPYTEMASQGLLTSTGDLVSTLTGRQFGTTEGLYVNRLAMLRTIKNFFLDTKSEMDFVSAAMNDINPLLQAQKVWLGDPQYKTLKNVLAPYANTNFNPEAIWPGKLVAKGVTPPVPSADRYLKMRIFLDAFMNVMLSWSWMEKWYSLFAAPERRLRPDVQNHVTLPLPRDYMTNISEQLRQCATYLVEAESKANVRIVLPDEKGAGASLLLSQCAFVIARNYGDHPVTIAFAPSHVAQNEAAAMMALFAVNMVFDEWMQPTTGTAGGVTISIQSQTDARQNAICVGDWA